MVPVADDRARSTPYRLRLDLHLVLLHPTRRSGLSPANSDEFAPRRGNYPEQRKVSLCPWSPGFRPLGMRCHRGFWPRPTRPTRTGFHFPQHSLVSAGHEARIGRADFCFSSFWARSPAPDRIRRILFTPTTCESVHHVDPRILRVMPAFPSVWPDGDFFPLVDTSS